MGAGPKNGPPPIRHGFAKNGRGRRGRALFDGMIRRGKRAEKILGVLLIFCAKRVGRRAETGLSAARFGIGKAVAAVYFVVCAVLCKKYKLRQKNLPYFEKKDCNSKTKKV